MRRTWIRPPYPRLFTPQRRPVLSRASLVRRPIVVPPDEGPTEEQLADHWESFNLYDVEDPLVQTLSEGFGWTGAWSLSDDSIFELATDDFESYSVEDPVSVTLNGGDGWTGAFTIVKRT